MQMFRYFAETIWPWLAGVCVFLHLLESSIEKFRDGETLAGAAVFYAAIALARCAYRGAK